MAAASDALGTFLAARNRLALTLFSAEAYYNVVEASFLLLVLYLALTRAYKPRSAAPSVTVRAQRLASWRPKPLARPLAEEEIANKPVDVALVSGATPIVTTVQGDELMNLATTNFLGLATDSRVTARAQEVLKSYGCGSCGPRGFYGTTDVHLRAEDSIARFAGTNGAILYSHGAATSSSTIPAFAKRGDLIVHDERVNFGLQTGMSLSRAETRPFRHNDLKHLESVMRDVVAGDSKDPSRKRTQKRFLVVEAVYATTGEVAALDAMIALKIRYGFRIVVDESLSLGVLGATGRGALERFDVKRCDVDIALADLGNALGTVGGFCVGDNEVVSHQRLSGAGYCFSASQPPFLAAAATEALAIIDADGEALTDKLRANTRVMRKALRSRLSERWVLTGTNESPIMHVYARDSETDSSVLTQVQKQCMERGVLLNRPEYVAQDKSAPAPSLRITVMAAHKPARLREAAAIIVDVLEQSLVE